MWRSLSLRLLQQRLGLLDAGAVGSATIQVVVHDDLGHAIDDRSMQFALDHLRYTVPKHYFDEALSGGKPDNDDIVEFM